ncbi:MAG: bis(5'-nucleosyl)-tetraphosphatase [Nitrososphaerales archaeon]|uniref:Bis(5'-nucleosyl)-tetraphosphatase [asymmetrical] n=1 Tax=uncultured marine thaumarchaeote KM3_47_C08 TaxID=1456167 RepID=A0A075H487_9ARCH|nr:NUDIX hydrolase [uncultured marine thaumarchaeote KM3_47_C08]
MIEERSAGVILFNKTGGIQFLVLKYPSGHWDFVKGNIEEGEEEEETVKRELFEETGINNLEIHQGFNEKAEYNYYKKNNKVHKIVSYYLAETNQKQVKLSFEHLDHKWSNYEDSMKLITFENSKEILKKGNETINNPTKN